MAEATLFLSQSRYYSPVFNSAIFDGPVRVYFAQHQESLALKVYFRLKERLKSIGDEVRYSGQHLFVMLYPSDESFELSFSGAAPKIAQELLGEDFVFGVKGPLEDEAYESLYAQAEKVLHSWRQEERREGVSASPLD